MLTDGKPIAQDSNDSNHKPHHQEKVNDDNDAIKDHAREQASADAKLNAAEHAQPAGAANASTGVVAKSAGARVNIETVDDDDDDKRQEEIKAKMEKRCGKGGCASMKLCRGQQKVRQPKEPIFAGTGTINPHGQSSHASLVTCV